MSNCGRRVSTGGSPAPVQVRNHDDAGMSVRKGAFMVIVHFGLIVQPLTAESSSPLYWRRFNFC